MPCFRIFVQNQKSNFTLDDNNLCFEKPFSISSEFCFIKHEYTVFSDQESWLVPPSKMPIIAKTLKIGKQWETHGMWHDVTASMNDYEMM